MKARSLTTCLAVAVAINATVGACALLPGASPTTSGTPVASSTVSTSPQPSASIEALPVDVYRLGDVRLAGDDEAVGAISASAAAEAAAEAGYAWPGA